MISYLKVFIRVNGILSSTHIVSKSILFYECLNKAKDAYYKGRKNWKVKDKFEIYKIEVVKENIGLNNN